jgi:putative restriction endonuclease
VERHELDDRLRAAAFTYLTGLTTRIGDQRVSYRDLETFEFEGRLVPLIQRMRGIRVVSGLEAALSILTTFAARPEDRPYEDTEGFDGYWRYKWRGTDPEGYDNVALRRAMDLGKPLLWFVGVASGVYVPIYPVWLVGEEPAEHQFVVALDEEMRSQWDSATVFHPADLALRRQYARATVRRRLHQPVFRERVLLAYLSQCALCRLRHPELLDAAHLKEDSDGGEPVVPNGVAMCAIHHRSFDKNVLGVRPDYMIELRRDVREERDGPTLTHILQGLHGEKLTLPRQRSAWPNRELLEERYERSAGLDRQPAEAAAVASYSLPK